MKILTLDIETSPNLGYVWSLWNQNISLPQLVESGEVMGVGWKWYRARDIHFASVHCEGREAMLQQVYEAISEADAIVHFNGKSFDMPWLNAEFARMGWNPPAPYAQIDLLKVVKKNFRFPSNKLDYVVQQFGLGKKTSHTGFQLWLDCMAGDDKAWALMEKYCKQDVRITEKLYDYLLGWISNHPWDVPGTCMNCGGTKLVRRGTARTAASTFQRYQCGGCGKWSRSSSRLSGTDLRDVA